jgi:hypothetical protein
LPVREMTYAVHVFNHIGSNVASNLAEGNCMGLAGASQSNFLAKQGSSSPAKLSAARPRDPPVNCTIVAI